MILFFILILAFEVFGQSKINRTNPYLVLQIKDSTRQSNRALKMSTRGNAYQFMEMRGFLNANNALIEKKYDEIAIEYQLILIENIIESSQISKLIKNNKSSYKDNFKTWITISDREMQYKEGPLYEGYAFFYIAQFLYYTKKNGWSDASIRNNQRWKNVLTFIEENVWTKWYERSLKRYKNKYRFFLWSRTHMGSHWAGVAMYVGELSENESIRKQCNSLVIQYDTLLKRNFKTQGEGYVWNCTYDYVKGTDADASKEKIMQDVSHGNHVVSYIIAAYEFGNKNWILKDVKKLAFTFSNFIYDEKQNEFNDNVDGSNIINGKNNGDFVGDGWVKLAKYDKHTKNIMNKLQETNSIYKYNQEIPFKSNLLNIN